MQHPIVEKLDGTRFLNGFEWINGLWLIGTPKSSHNILQGLISPWMSIHSHHQASILHRRFHGASSVLLHEKDLCVRILPQIVSSTQSYYACTDYNDAFLLLLVKHGISWCRSYPIVVESIGSINTASVNGKLEQGFLHLKNNYLVINNFIFTIDFNTIDHPWIHTHIYILLSLIL